MLGPSDERTYPVAFFELGHHDDRRTVVLPNHTPEIRHRVRERTLHTDRQTDIYRETQANKQPDVHHCADFTQCYDFVG